MSHWAQYRHRGGHVTGFLVARPTASDFQATSLSLHVRVIVGAGPGAPVTGLRVYTYLIATPNVINETLDVALSLTTSLTFTYALNDQVGVRAAWIGAGGVVLSPFSAQQIVVIA